MDNVQLTTTTPFFYKSITLVGFCVLLSMALPLRSQMNIFTSVDFLSITICFYVDFSFYVHTGESRLEEREGLYFCVLFLT